MPDSEETPRVLIVVITKVKADDPANLLIRMQFGDWPAECLAQIHSGETEGHGEFCGRYYRIQACDRLLGRVFMKLRSKTLSTGAAQFPAQAGQPKPSFARRLQKWINDILVKSGLWEICFPIRLSEPMRRFIREFRPDVIYCTGYHLGFATLPLLISKRFGLPICFQTFEDWPSYGAHGLIAPVVRKRSAELIQRASVRLAFGPKMRAEYQRRYGVEFELTYHLDDPRRFGQIEPPRYSRERHIVFTGSLVLNRHEPLLDLLKAVRKLKTAPAFHIDIYCPGVPQEMPRELLDAAEVSILPLPSHEELPAVLNKADILFLPEAFSVDEQRLGMALSTKCHLYMMAQRPVLVYGPAYAGSVDYAASEGWATVVAERSPDVLARVLEQLPDDPKVLERQREAGQRCVADYHDVFTGRIRFRGFITKAAGMKNTAGIPV